MRTRMAEKGIDPLEIRVNLAAGALPSPESDIFQTVRKRLAVLNRPAVSEHALNILRSLGVDSSFENDYDKRLDTILLMHFGPDDGFISTLADELERIYDEQVKSSNCAREITCLIGYVEQLRFEAAKQQKQRFGDGEIQLRLRKYQIWYGSDRIFYRIRGWVCLGSYILTKRITVKATNGLRYLKDIKSSSRLRGVMIQTKKNAGSTGGLNVDLLPLCQPKMTNAEFSSAQTALDYLVKCGFEKSKLIDMPIEVLFGVAMSDRPEVAILQSRNLFRTNRWGIPEYVRDIAAKIHHARVKTCDLCFRTIDDFALKLGRQGKMDKDQANELTLRLIFNFGYTEESWLGFMQVLNLLSLNGLSSESYIGLITSQQLARQFIHLAEVDKETKRVTREWDVDLTKTLSSVLVNRAFELIPEEGLTRIERDNLENRLSNTHRSYANDSDERMRIKERIRSGQEDNPYVVLRFGVFGTERDVWSYLPLWQRVKFFQDLMKN